MNKKIFILLSIFLTTAFLAGCSKKNETQIQTKTPQTDDRMGLFVVKVDDKIAPTDTSIANTEGTQLPMNICIGNIVENKIDEKLTPQEALEKLFTYKPNSSDGLYNVFNKFKDIKIKDLVIKNNFAIVRLSGDFTGAQECDGQLAHDQIVKTLSQFDNIAGADVFIEDEEITGYFATLNNNAIK